MTTQPSPEHILSVSERASCLYDAHEVEKAIDAMGETITKDMSELNPVVLCVMIGGVVPTGRLLTKLNFPLQVDYVHATRYGHDFVGDELEWLVHPRVPLKDRTVLIVDDILDGGITLTKIAEYCKNKGARLVKTAVLVEKQVKREQGAIKQADYTGCVIEDKFVFGYGMDYKRYLRNAPGIYAVHDEDHG